MEMTVRRAIDFPQATGLEMKGEGKTVCVTGASGYIASWIVKLLLKNGYTVKATVQDLDDPKQTEHLIGLEGRLSLYEADLLEEGSFDSAIDGCDGVFHTASPVLLHTTNPQGDLIEPAVKGTINVLGSCTKVASVKRVILTSSIAAVTVSKTPMTPDVVVDETWFSDPAICKELKLWYPLSKTLAEEAAWSFANENGIHLITINPGFAIGPILPPTLNLSVGLIHQILTGSEHTLRGLDRFVDVRDVAYAHMKAFEEPTASGRYCLVGRVIHHSETLKILHQLYPENMQIARKCEENKFDEPTYSVSQDKAKRLGVNFIPLDISLRDTVESLKEKGFLKQS